MRAVRRIIAGGPLPLEGCSMAAPSSCFGRTGGFPPPAANTIPAPPSAATLLETRKRARARDPPPPNNKTHHPPPRDPPNTVRDAEEDARMRAKCREGKVLWDLRENY